MGPIRVLLVDDSALFRGGVADILQADGRFVVAGQVSRASDAIAAAAELKPDLVLMDLRMPGMTGGEAIRRIRSDGAAVPIGVLSVYETADHVQAALAAGATGYIAKDATPADLCDAAAAIASGEAVIAVPSKAPANATPAKPTGVLARLTARELEILRALTTGASNQAIARRLGISPKTLRNHISNTYHKLQIYDRAQAVILAVREGLIDVPSRKQ
jgi:DNA-binding NarL/FixJ family response regulator